MSTKRKATPGEDHAGMTSEFLLMCVQTTANLTRVLSDCGHCPRDLYDSLRAIQLIIERDIRKEQRTAGLDTSPVGKLMLQMADQLERDIEKNIAILSRDIMSATNQKILK